MLANRSLSEIYTMFDWTEMTSNPVDVKVRKKLRQ